METDFWHERWKNGQIGFHQDETNSYLLKHWEKLALDEDSLIFVPMAGKSKDILWLTEQGYKVIAIELSEHAVKAFFSENELAFTIEESHTFTIYRSENIKFYCGNYFDLSSDIMKDVKAVFDRASLIAMPPAMRKLYQLKMNEILPIEAKILLVTMEYPQQQMDGPPFSVLEEEVNALYSTKFKITLLETFDVLAENPRFADKGLTQMLEKVYVLQPNT